MSEGYGGNKYVKAPNLTERFTHEEAAEILKCENDPLYFCNNYMKVISEEFGPVLFKPYSYQEEMIYDMQNHKRLIALLGRQMGKCVEYDTIIEIMSPEGTEYKIKIGDFFAWQKFKEEVKDLR